MTHRRSPLNRADLLPLLAAGDERAADALAGQLGLVRDPERVVDGGAGLAGGADVTAEATVKPADPQPTPVPPATFWHIYRHEAYEPLAQPAGTPRDSESPPSATPKAEPAPARFQPLVEPARLLPRFDPYMAGTAVGRRIDVPRLVRRISRGEPVTDLPRARRHAAVHHLHAIQDRQAHLLPYLYDQAMGALLAGARWPDTMTGHAVWPDGASRPASVDAEDLPVRWQPPPAESLVLVFSDLGALAADRRERVARWLEVVDILRRRNARIVALVPCRAEAIDPRLRRHVTVEPWVPAPAAEPPTPAQRHEQVELLVTLLAPATRIEPGLLRAMRLAVNRHGHALEPDVESLVWQHAFIRHQHTVAATPDTALRKQYLRRFEEQAEQLTDGGVDLREVAMAVIGGWHRHGEGFTKHVWLEEMASLGASAWECVPREDLERAQACFRGLETQLDSDGAGLDDNTRYWLLQCKERLINTGGLQGPLGATLQRIVTTLHPDDASQELPGAVEPQNLPASDAPERTLALYQHADSLRLQPYRPQDPPPERSSLLGILRQRGDEVSISEADGGHWVTARLNEKEYAAYNFDGLDAADGFIVRSDVEAVWLGRMQRPAWAANAGRDQFGLFADLEIEGVVQRFRWIPPGQFWMGSPPDEAERFDNEEQHLVTLTQSFWLGDTAVTQAMWQAITGKNPSYFKGDEQPVEQVSWEDAQRFLGELNRRFEELDARLPTEAEWEYACRAGTTTPFAFAEQITPTQVQITGAQSSYDDGFPYEYDEYFYPNVENLPYADVDKGEYYDAPVPVMTLPANPWGLYEMHGNVWEWCQDLWQDNLGEVPAEDPRGPTKGLGRVLRGGSSLNDARSIRSACRTSLRPRSHTGIVGFRLALGHTGKAGTALP